MSKKDSRRKLLKSIAASGGAVVAGKSLPESWSKPIVDAVILPAHAQTTDETIIDPTTTVAPTTTPEATTTQGCCLIEATYCTPLGNQLGHLEIDVTTAGSITVRVYFDGVQTVTDTIPCTGGTFTASDSDHMVTGTVGCAATSVSGMAYIFNGDPTKYIATPDNCRPD